MKKRCTEGLAGTTVQTLEEKARSTMAPGVGAAGGVRAGHEWKTIGAVAADILARCQQSKYRMTCAN